MENLTTHYQQLLGLPATWAVEDVKLSLSDQLVAVRLRFISKEVICPVCGLPGTRYDHAPEQSWRHLDTMQFETRIIARIPRCQCPECGVKTITVPWAGRHSRFTLMFEGFAVALLQHCSSLQAAAMLLRLDWHTVDEIMKQAVQRGLDRREPEAVAHLGLDEKSFKRGHRYITLLNDLDDGRVLDVVEERTIEATDKLLQTLTEEQQKRVKSVSLDLWQAFATAVQTQLPDADMVYDRFHVSKYLNDAVDQVRREESQQLSKQGDKTLVGSKFSWLRNPENMTSAQRAKFDLLMEAELKTGVAWSIKNGFRKFWDLPSPKHGELYFWYWSLTVDQSGLAPLIEVKEMLERHRDNLMNWFKHRVTNAVSEGLNSTIQALKAAARGFHNFESYQTRILFFCGKLKMQIAAVT